MDIRQRPEARRRPADTSLTLCRRACAESSPSSLTDTPAPASDPPPSTHVTFLQRLALRTRARARRVKYPVAELLIGDSRNNASALHLVCQNWRYGPSLLCPEGSLEFVSGFSKHVGLVEFVRSIVEESAKPSTDGADLPEEMVRTEWTCRQEDPGQGLRIPCGGT